MPSKQVTLTALGLNYSPNQLSAPEGSLVQADDIVIRRDNSIESRRGYRQYSEGFSGGSNRVKQLIEYKDRLLVHHGSTLEFDTEVLDSDEKSVFSAFNGSYSEVETGLRIKSIEANKNLYFTTSDGIKKISAASADDFSTASGYVMNAGAVKALDINGSLVIEQGQTSGFLPVDTAVAYRTLWGYKDANDNLILGTPSNRTTVYNYLSDIIALDLNELALQLDNIDQTGSMIEDGNYFSTYYTASNPDADTLQANILSLAEKLDTELLFGDVAGSAPLDMNTIEIDTLNVGKIIFDAGMLPENYLVVGDYIYLNGFGTIAAGTNFGIVNGAQQITSVVPDASNPYITFTVDNGNTAKAATAVIAGATINSYNYRHITNTASVQFDNSLEDLVLSIPATSNDYRIMQDALSQIVERLKVEPNAVIPSAFLASYITPFVMTERANAQLEINIPDDVTVASGYFYQVYRTLNFTATDTQTLGGSGGIPVEPDDEMRLVFEGFPTSDEITAGYLTYTDISPEELIQNNTNLYTNPQTGDGILGSNDIPPLAHDINTFKNVTFYSNTRTRHRIPNFTLIGISEIDSGDKITIANLDSSLTYTFTTGVKEKSVFKVTSGTSAANLKSAFNGKYFLINTPTESFYVWYRYDDAAAITDPALSNKTGILVNLITGDTVDSLVSKTSNTINANIFNFVSDNTGTIVSNSVAAASVVTTTGNHGLASTETVTISHPDVDTDSTPTIDGARVVTVTAATTFTVPVNVTVAGTTGTFAYPSNYFTVENTNEGIASTSTIGNIASYLSFTRYLTGNGEDITTRQVLLSSLESAAQAIEATAQSLTRVINRQGSDSIINSFYTSGDTSPPGQMNFEMKTLDEDPFYVLGSDSGVGESFSPDITPDKTISLVDNTTPARVTSGTTSGIANGDQVIISGSDSTPIVDGIHTATVVSSTIFSIPTPTVTVDGTAVGGWSFLEDAVASTNEVKPNRVYYSKYSQPEAVPITNYFDLGAEDKQILRIFPLRDTLFVFKEDGTYRVSGASAPFTRSLLDSGYVVIAPDSVDVANNIVYAWTEGGIVPMTESGGGQAVSRPIDTEILRLAGRPFTNFSTVTWGMGYNSDDSYTVYTNSETDDEVATIGFRFCTLTNTWTNFQRSQTCGMLNDSIDTQYLGSGTRNSVDIERKNFDRTDFADAEFYIDLEASRLTNNDLTMQFDTLVLDTATTPDIEFSVGDVITQEQTLTIYLYNKLLTQLDLDPTVNFTNYFSTLEAIPGDDMRAKIVALATKLDLDSGITNTDYASRIGNKTGSVNSNTAADPTVVSATNHGLVDNRYIEITTANGSIPTIVGKHTVANTGTFPTSDTFTVDVDVTTAGTTGATYETLINTFEDLKGCFNDIVAQLNADSGATFTNYKPISSNTTFEAVVMSINTTNDKVTLNLPLQWVVGPVTVYKAINSEFTYSPAVMEDPLAYKHISEATFMFANRAITGFTGSFSSDLKPTFTPQEFFGQGNGTFGNYSDPGFGNGFFGGASNSAPFRTTIPKINQRCRFLNIQVNHCFAREIWSLYGVTLSGQIGISTRAYR